jgi:hypothetical protein
MVIYTYKKNALFFDAEKVMNRGGNGKRSGLSLEVFIGNFDEHII